MKSGTPTGLNALGSVQMGMLSAGPRGQRCEEKCASSGDMDLGKGGWLGLQRWLVEVTLEQGHCGEQTKLKGRVTVESKQAAGSR